jgi:hypothetical protein
MDTALEKKIKARERAREWREDRIGKGLCPKDGTPVSRLKHCYTCRPNEPLRSPKKGDVLKSCCRCDECGKHYHEGTHYNYNPPSSRKQHGIKPGPNNSLFNFDERKPGDYNKVLSLCGECRKENLGKWEYRNSTYWSGLCYPHSAKSRMKQGHMPHPSGAIVHRTERILEAGQRKRPVKVRFTCANREKPPHQGETYLSATKRDEWQGLCHQCLKDQPPQTKLNEDQKINGALLCFSEEDAQKRVPIFYDVCQHKRLAPRQTALSYRHTGKVSGVCLECRNNPAALAERTQQIVGQKNENAENTMLKKRFEEVVHALKQRMAPHRIKRRTIADEYHDRGEYIHPSTISKRIVRLYGEGTSIADAVARVP